MDRNLDNVISFSLPVSSENEVCHDHLTGGRLSRKRARESIAIKVEESLDDPLDMTDDGRPKTRRVNPQRLAVRLGSDLVAEMEALIVPGAKMPTFTVRKDFQERYCVDRRHIYDYFHSRGLRVAKEDKHTNLIRGRALKAAAAAITSKPHSTGSTESKSSMDDASAISVSTPRLAKAKLKHRSKVAKSMKIISKTEDTKTRRIFLASPSSNNARRPSSIFPEASLPSSMISRSLTPQRLWNGLSSPCPELLRLEDFSDGTTSQEKSPDLNFFKSSEEHSVYFAPPMETSPLLCENEHSFLAEPDVFLCQPELEPITRDDHLPLNRHERAELYDLINNTLHSTTGIGESAGTYEAYMKGRNSAFYSYDPQVRLNADPGIIPFLGERNIFPYGSSNEGLSDLVDLDTWLSGDLMNFGDGLTGTQNNPVILGNGLSGTRPTCFPTQSGESLGMASDSKENTRYSREKSFNAGHTRLRTTSARGQI